MKKIKVIVCLIIPIFLGIIFSEVIDGWLDNKINLLMEQKDIYSVKHAIGDIKEKGIVFNSKVINNGDIFIQGSSELGSDVEQNPSRFFPISSFNYDTLIEGRAHVQDLAHAALIGSQKNIGENNKVVLILSLQWFLEKEGTDTNSFQGTFSPVQFYEYLSNDRISDKNKLIYANRIKELLESSEQYKSEWLYAKLYSSEGVQSKVLSCLLSPYYFVREKLVALKDKGLLYKELKGLPEKSELEVKDINWKEEYDKAKREGEEAVTNNDLMVDDGYYNEVIVPIYEKMKDRDININLLESKEFTDYELYLDTCLELGIKPYVVLMPVNGLWYDYTGITQDKRIAFYNKAQKIAEDKGISVLNLSDKEYQPYYLKDVMHLGWEGWLNVNEEIYKYFSER